MPVICAVSHEIVVCCSYRNFSLFSLRGRVLKSAHFQARIEALRSINYGCYVLDIIPLPAVVACNDCCWLSSRWQYRQDKGIKDVAIVRVEQVEIVRLNERWARKIANLRLRDPYSTAFSVFCLIRNLLCLRFNFSTTFGMRSSCTSSSGGGLSDMKTFVSLISTILTRRSSISSRPQY